MPKLFDSLGYDDKRNIAIFVVGMLAFTSLSFIQGTVIQQVMDLHLSQWPIVAVRNLFAVIGLTVAMGIYKNWI